MFNSEVKLLYPLEGEAESLVVGRTVTQARLISTKVLIVHINLQRCLAYINNASVISLFRYINDSQGGENQEWRAGSSERPAQVPDEVWEMKQRSTTADICTTLKMKGLGKR